MPSIIADYLGHDVITPDIAGHLNTFIVSARATIIIFRFHEVSFSRAICFAMILHSHYVTMPPLLLC